MAPRPSRRVNYYDWGRTFRAEVRQRSKTRQARSGGKGRARLLYLTPLN